MGAGDSTSHSLYQSRANRGVNFLSVIPTDPQVQLFSRVLVPLTWKPRANRISWYKPWCVKHLQVADQGTFGVLRLHGAFLLAGSWVSSQSQLSCNHSLSYYRAIPMSPWVFHKPRSLQPCAMWKQPSFIPYSLERWGSTLWGCLANKLIIFTLVAHGWRSTSQKIFLPKQRI